MSDAPFEGKADFNNQSFYYFLPMFNFEQKQKIGEKIAKFKGLISFSLKENINILISTINDINTPKFREEILTSGNVTFYGGEKLQKIECINKSLTSPENYKCILLEIFWKVVKKFDESDEIINYFKKRGLNDNINLPASIIYQVSPYNTKLFNYYEFPKIEEAVLIKKSISEYDIPQLIPDMPQGFSIFCTVSEASKVKHYLELNEEEKNVLLGMQQKEDNNDNDNNITEEPIPKTKFCHLCMRKFDDYLLHIETLTHKNNIKKNPLLINRAKDTFDRINSFWNNKVKEKDKENNYNIFSKSQKEDKLYHNKINSLSSFSSSASTFRNEESVSVSLFKSINSLLLDPEIIESDKNKENLDNSNIKKMKSRDIFITPKKKSECKYSSYFSSSQSNFMCTYLNKKRKMWLEEDKKEKEKKEDYFNGLNTKKVKRLIRGKDVFFK